MRPSIKAQFAVGVAIILTGAAVAAEGKTLEGASLRSGPGGSFPTVEAIQPGHKVEIGDCIEGWCEVQVGSVSGWIEDQYLQRRPATSQPGGPKGVANETRPTSME